MRRPILKSKHGFLGVFMLLLFTGFIWVQFFVGQEEERIVEKVTVTNVEVPVRVLFKKDNQPVVDLKKEEFTLYEDGKKMEINGFYQKSKTIKLMGELGTETAAAETVPVQPTPRAFVLVFNVVDYNQNFKDAVAYLFEKVLREDDGLMIFANDYSQQYPDLKNKQQIRENLEKALREEGIKAHQRLSQYITRLEGFLNVQDFRVEVDNSRGSDPVQKMIDFLKKYLIAWNEYKGRYLTPRPDRFYYFSRYLEKIRGEKWVLNFYQFELFPRIRLSGETMNRIKQLAGEMSNSNDATTVALSRTLDAIMNQLVMDLNVNNSFDNKEIVKLFYKVDATFHSFFIKSMKIVESDNFEYRQLSSDIEQVLKGITDATGGQNITSNDIVSSLDKVREVEDVYYVLTYIPKNPRKAGELKIKVKRSGCKVLYDNNFRADYISDYFKNLEKTLNTPDVKIEKFSFSQGKLAFAIKDFLMRKVDDKTMGQLKVHIRVIDSSANTVLFNAERVLTAQKAEFNISLVPVKDIKKGEYNFLIDVTDLFTNKEHNFHESVSVR